MSERRIAAGSIVAAIVAAAGPGICFGIANGGPRIFGPPEPHGAWDWLLGPLVGGLTTLMYGWWIALAHQFLLGLPLYLLLRRRWQLRWRSATIAGALIGVIPVSLFFWLTSPSTDNLFLAAGYWLPMSFASSGAAAGLAFWAATRGGKAVSG